jgi:hypothetical protein
MKSVKVVLEEENTIMVLLSGVLVTCPSFKISKANVKTKRISDTKLPDVRMCTALLSALFGEATAVASVLLLRFHYWQPLSTSNSCILTKLLLSDIYGGSMYGISPTARSLDAFTHDPLMHSPMIR